MYKKRLSPAASLPWSEACLKSTGCTVVTKPVEVTAIGNILMQAISPGCLKSLFDARTVVRRLYSVEIYHSTCQGGWDDVFVKLLSLIVAIKG